MKASRDYFGYVCTPASLGAPIDYVLSTYGESILEESGIYSVDDAVERFIEEIDYLDRKIAEIDTGYQEVFKMQLEAPLEIDYQDMYERLIEDREHYLNSKHGLEMDLKELVGDGLWDCPWEE